MEFNTGLQKYLAWKATYTIRATQTYPIHIRKLGESCGFKNLEDLTDEDITKFNAEMKAKYAYSHVSQSMFIIKDFVKFWSKKGVMKIDPFFIRPPKYHTKPHTPITYDEFCLLCDTMSEQNYHDLQVRTALKMLWWSGMRVSELTDIRIDQIDTHKREIVIMPKKTNRMRIIAWSEDTHKLLLQYIGVRICLNQNPYLFDISTRGVQRWIKEACKRAGITKKVSPHSFRHGLVHYLHELGMDTASIQAYIGHSSVESTIKNYMVWNTDELRTFRNLIEKKHALRS